MSRPLFGRESERLRLALEEESSEVNSARQVILEQPGYAVARILERLEREYFRLTAREYDAELSRRLLEALLPLYGEDDPEPVLERFLADNGDKLARLYRQYLDDSRASSLLFQPEAIIIFDLLQRARSTR